MALQDGGEIWETVSILAQESGGGVWGAFVLSWGFVAGRKGKRYKKTLSQEHPGASELRSNLTEEVRSEESQETCAQPRVAWPAGLEPD